MSVHAPDAESDTEVEGALAGVRASGVGVRTFALARVRTLRVVDGDLLHDRWHAVDARGRAVTLLSPRSRHVSLEHVQSAWLAQAARNHRLAHPGLVPLLDYGVCGERAYATLARVDDALPLSMLLAGGPLRQRAPWPGLAVHIVGVLCELLAAAHDLRLADAPHPLVHADLCCERVLVRADGTLQLAELGLWCALPPAHARALRAARGQAAHVAPEQETGACADARGDVFALGVLLRRVLASATAVVGGETHRVVAPTHVALSGLLGGMLAPEPGARIASIAALRKALRPHRTRTEGAALLAALHAEARARAAGDRGRSAATMLYVRATGLSGVQPERPALARARSPRAIAEPRSDAITAPRSRPAFPPPARTGIAAGGVTAAADSAAPAPSPPPTVCVPALVDAHEPSVTHASEASRGALPETRRMSAMTERAPSLAPPAAERLSEVASPRADDRWRDASDTVFAHVHRAQVTRVHPERERARLPRWLVALAARYLDAVVVALAVSLVMAALWLLSQLPPSCRQRTVTDSFEQTQPTVCTDME